MLTSFSSKPDTLLMGHLVMIDCLCSNIQRYVVDCHTATKFIAKNVRKGIILRDANHFDHIYDEKEEKFSVGGEIVQRITSTMSCCPSH
jgi:hypothetical protein